MKSKKAKKYLVCTCPSVCADKGATELHLFLHGEPARWEILGGLREPLSRWQPLYSRIVLLMDADREQQLTDVVKEDLWVLQRLGIKTAVMGAGKHPGPVIAQALSSDKRTTFACSNQQTVIPTEHWLDDAENMVIYANDYPLVPISRYLEESHLKPQQGPGDIEIEILLECNGKLSEFADKFWRLLTEQHQPLQQHLRNGDELSGICYSDRYIYSPWTVLLIAELIDGFRQIMQGSWSKPEISIFSAPKLERDAYQQRGLFADWLDDRLRLAVIESYFAVMDEKCLVKASNDTPHGRFMQLNWRSGKTTTLRFDQGVSYWGCADKPPYFDNSAPALEQADKLIDLIRHLKVRNYKDFPTQIFVKER